MPYCVPYCLYSGDSSLALANQGGGGSHAIYKVEPRSMFQLQGNARS